MDPVSIVGLTLSVLDTLFKVGERTAELVSNFREFDNDSRTLEMKIRDENNRTRALNMLLFEASSIYRGRSLFEQFDTDVQEQIHLFIEQAAGVLDQAFQLLRRRQETFGKEKEAGGNGGARSPTPPAIVALSGLASKFSLGSDTSHEFLLRPEPLSPSASAASGDGGMRRPRSFVRLRWSLLDKKRVEGIVREFSELNGRIHESIKLWCLGTAIGVDLQHLRRLENDGNSQALGFDVDARLQLAATGSSSSKRPPSSSAIVAATNSPALSLELEDAALRRQLVTDDFLHIGDNFGVLRDADGKMRLVEFRSYADESPVPVELDDRTRDLVDKLANLLHQPKEVIFRTPHCVGWVRHMQKNRVAFVFAFPDTAAGTAPEPISLLKVISGGDSSSSSSSSSAPSLGMRFWLAARLARCISQLQLVKWVHESFRSENILFFPKSGDDATSTTTTTLPENRLDFREPWVLGFEFSRPEMYFSQGHADVCLTRDVYRHPDRQRSPTKPFNKMHDIYALGVVLLEIGLWQPALTLEKSGFARVQDPHAIRKHLVRHAEKRLGAKMGERYRNVVLTCLQGSFEVQNDTKEDLKLQQAFRAQVVEPLEKAAEYI